MCTKIFAFHSVDPKKKDHLYTMLTTFDTAAALYFTPENPCLDRIVMCALYSPRFFHSFY